MFSADGREGRRAFSDQKKIASKRKDEKLIDCD